MNTFGRGGFTLIALCFVLTGCELLGPGDDVRYTYTTERTEFAAGDSLKAVFKNHGVTLYVVLRCPTADIEQYVGSSWQPVELGVDCTMVALPPLPLHSGQEFPVWFSPRLLQAAELHPGAYRLTVTIAKSQDGDVFKATSNRFEIVRK